MSERQPAAWATAILGIVAAGILTLALLVPLWLLGGISRVKIRVMSSDGGLEAVCRGRLPESTEYDLWLRRWWQPWGNYAAASGTESMGRCREIVWSPDGAIVVVVNEGNTIAVVDAVARLHLGTHGLAPGETGSYPSRRIITSLHFVSNGQIAFEHCDRLWFKTGRNSDSWRCGQDVRLGHAQLILRDNVVEVTVTADRH